MKFTKSLVTAALVASAFGLSACGGSNGAAAESSAAGTAPSAAAVEKQTPKPAADPEKSSRGNYIMKAGGKAFATQTDVTTDKVTAKYTIDSIKPGTCTEQYASAPTNGNVVFVKVTAQTTPDLAKAIVTNFSISPYDFKFIAKNGTTFNGQLSGMSFGCIPDAETFPSSGIGPDQKASGIIVLDVPQPHGTLLVKSDYGTGYEYTF